MDFDLIVRTKEGFCGTLSNYSLTVASLHAYQGATESQTERTGYISNA